MLPMENATPTSAYTHASSTQTASTVHAQSPPNEIVGAAPVCPPERSHSGVSIPKIHALCARDERRMRPYWATRAGTQAPPLPISVIFFHAIPHTQNNHLRAIHPNGIKPPHAIHSNETNRLHAIYPNETVGAVPACPPERSRSGVSIRMFSYTKLLFTSYKICLHATVEDYQKYNFVSFHTPVHYGQHDPNSYAATTAHRKALNCAASLVLYMHWLSSF